jgi:selenocysteine-specific elongation factor
MIGAASGIDGALLVVAANEGVMPQTREHLAIARLLDVKTGIVVLSKCDLADATELSVCEAEIRELVASTFLHHAPVLRVSASRGDGIAQLREALEAIQVDRDVDENAPFLMSVDRSFTVSGFGRVVTGTVQSGSVDRGGELSVMPSRGQVAVRRIQVHGSDVDSAYPGERAALNLRVSSGTTIDPGDVLGQANAVQASRRLDVLIEPLPEFAEAIANGARLRVLVGTSDAQARLRILERSNASAADGVLAQLRCDREVATRPGTRFILRRNSPAATVGGGVVIDADAPRRRRFATEENDAVASLVGARPADVFESVVRAAGYSGLDRDAAARRMCVRTETIDAYAHQSPGIKAAGQRYCGLEFLRAVEERVLTSLQAYHQAHPQHAGMRQADLIASLPEVHEAIVRAACEALSARSLVAAEADSWRLASFDHVSRLSEAERRLAERIEAVFLESGIAARPLSEIASQSPAARETLRFLLETGRIVRLQTRDRNKQLALHVDAIVDVQTRIQNRYPFPAEFAVSEVRDLLGTTRRYAVPLLEHLDATGFTLRKGDMRQIRQ